MIFELRQRAGRVQIEDIKMKKTTLALMIGVFTASTLFSGLSRADGPDRGPDAQWHHDGDRDRRDAGGPHDRGRFEHNDRADRDGRPSHDWGRAGPHERERFVWNGHDFRRGYPAPERFRGDDYRINDWRERGLYEPPRGAHWAYVDGNYVLIAAATGVITAIIVSSLLGQH